MKTKINPLIRVLLMWAVICCTGYVRAQTTTLYVNDSTVNSCNNNGKVNVYVTGGTAPYTYTLTGAYGTVYGPVTQSGSQFTGIPQGYYTVIVSDANGVNNSAQPAYAYINPTFYAYVNVIPAVCPSTLGSEYVSVYNYNGGTGTYSYLWSDASTADTVLNVPVGIQYQCTVTDISTGCTALAADSGTMYQTSSITGTFATTAANCTNGTATITPSGGTAPYTFVWSNGQTVATSTGLSAGYPTVTVTDLQGCTAVEYTSIQQAITISTQVNTTAEHCNDANGTLTVSALNATAPFTYQWSSGQTDPHITGLSAGYYSVSMTDHLGCTAYAYGQVQKSTPIVLTTSSTATLCTSPTGSVTVVATGGTAPYSYVWSCSPAQTTTTATALPAGYYLVDVVDAVGCTQNQSATVNNNTTLYAGVSTTNATCGGAPGTAYMSASGGATPYTYLWGTGATSVGLSGLSSGSYSCTVTDHAGCKVGSYAYVYLNSPVQVSVTPTAASCIYTADGTAGATVSGGTAPYTISWDNGQTGTAASGFLQGQHGVYVSDANGCSGGALFNIGYASTLPCSVVLSGNIYDDFNSNCMVDGMDAQLQGVWVTCSPGGGYQWTTNGYYNFTLPPGTYSIFQAPPLYHSIVCPLTTPTYTLTAGQNATTDFFYKPDTLVDLAINCIPYHLPRPGYTQHLRIFIRNLGNITESPNVVYQHALDINFLSASPAPDSYDPTTHLLTWNGPSLASTGTNIIDLYFGIPSNLPIGHILNNSDTVYPMVNDVDTFNNYEDVQGIVAGAYDPNYVDVLPKGTGTPGYISATTDTTLRYVVHFQNTGTLPATYVKLTIPIDANLDISTFRLIGTSHTVTSISTDANRLMTIVFNNINLADSGSNQLGSQGFAAFTFRQKKGLQPQATINENANIYFDYNAAVPTNTALNTIQGAAGIREVPAGALAIYPNPTQGNVTLDLSALDESRVQVRIYDVMGKVTIDIPATDVPASKKLNIQTSGFATGVYVVEVRGNASYVQKLVKTDK